MTQMQQTSEVKHTPESLEEKRHDELTNDQTACSVSFYGWRIPFRVNPTARIVEDSPESVAIDWHGLHIQISERQARQLVGVIAAVLPAEASR